MILKEDALRKLYTQFENKLRDVGFIAGKSGRHMKFPYTLSAKIAQFPYFHYLRNNRIWMYYPPGIIIASYFIYKIHLHMNSDANKQKWAETQRKLSAKEHDH